MYDPNKLIDLFRQRALQVGEFTLTSGKTSSYYLDGKQITLHSTGLRLLSEGLLDLLDDVEFEAIGGMSVGADPVVGGVLTVAAERGRPLCGFLVRREAKGHGTKQFIEGPLHSGTNVVVVDDVVTTGGSSLHAVERVREYGCNVVLVAGVVDRLQGGAENFKARNLPFRTLLTVRDLGIEPSSD